MSGRPPERGARGPYDDDLRDLSSMLRGVTDPISRMATIVAVLKERHPAVSWVGYYRLDDEGVLIVGPFQGPAACLRIAPGQGVCGAALERREALIVPDVREFPGHIACDPTSRSEIVLPVFDGAGRIRGVLDLDSRETGAFSDGDLKGLLPIAGLTFAPAESSVRPPENG